MSISNITRNITDPGTGVRRTNPKREEVKTPVIWKIDFFNAYSGFPIFRPVGSSPADAVCRQRWSRSALTSFGSHDHISKPGFPDGYDHGLHLQQ